MTEKEVIYISEISTIAYTKNQAFENDIPMKSDSPMDSIPKNIAYNETRNKYQQFFSRQYDNFVVLTGAGSSVGIGCGEFKGKTMRGLWETVVKVIGFEELKKFADKVNFPNMAKKYTDLEALISQANLSEAYKTQPSIQDTLKHIKSIIRDNCNLQLPDNAPHSIFLQKITSRKTKYQRAKIFTLNYDLLFEQAAAKGGYVVIDGFSFTMPRTFSGVNFDYDIVIRNRRRSVEEETFAPKVFHLYKPHGSLDWQRVIEEGKETFIISHNTDNPIMIYPSSAKYEASYEQPFFEMISRFQQELRERNTMLIIIGFSFYDKHIKAMITEALETNPSITIAVVAPDACQGDSLREMREKARHYKNVIMINETFADFAKYFPYSEIYDLSGETQI